jgi:adenine-specific DNA-methyltransferase
MPTLDWLNRDAAFRVADAVPTRVLRPHAAGHVFGQPGAAGNLRIQGDNLQALRALLNSWPGSTTRTRTRVALGSRSR